MVRTLLKSVKQYKTVSILTPLVMIGEAAMEIVIPFLMGFLIDEITAMAETQTCRPLWGKLQTSLWWRK